MDVSIPVVGATVKPDTVPSPLLTYRNWPLGSMAMPYGLVPTVIGVPTSVSAPVLSYENCVTVPGAVPGTVSVSVT